ncbi:dihydrodipicolinate synthase family protein [Membranihabitans marinus]|uniref:dihydrodipicolinate synthase family protein n=1 Tax=Membranihabitans marinus TaxID=1227546 RepID=UPI001F2EE3A7|nr:dihydrodipicolinate synthase family protein [Membranihabitans marinus]
MTNKTLYPLFGIVSVLNTPFTVDNEIDYPGLKKNIQYALSAGVAGFLVPGMAAEVHSLSKRERMDLVGFVLGEVNGKIPVIVGTSEQDFSKNLQLLDEYIRLGCSEVLFQIPYQNDDDFSEKFMRLADLGPKMIMLQDWDFNGYGLPDELILSLFEKVESFRCLKVETIPAGVKYSRIIEGSNGMLNVSGGWAVMQMMEALERGVHSFMPTGMHYTYTEIYRLFKGGQIEEARQWFEKILPVLAFSNQHLDISIYFFKKLLHKQGYYDTDAVRSPQLTFDSHHQRQAAYHIDRIISIESEIEKNRNSKSINF